MAAAQGLFNFEDLILAVSTEERALEWCRDKGLIPREIECPLCGELQQVRDSRKFGRFVCQKSVADHEVYGKFKMSAANTFFQT